MDSRISVIIAVWNGEKYLRKAIESALEQDYPNIEMIVVNDGSTDGTQQVIDAFGSRIRSLHQENRGLGAARNRGIEASTGNYIAFLDHDDYWEKGKLSLQIKQWRLEQDPLVFSFVKQFICSSLEEEEKRKLSVNEIPMPGYIAGTLLISKKRFYEVGPFIEEKEVGEFIDWFLRAKERQLPIAIIPEITLYRRVHQNNMGRQKELYKQTHYLKILKASLDRRRERL